MIVPPAKNDRLKLAETLLGKAVQLDPKIGEAYVQLGILPIAGNPNLAEAHFRLAQAYKRAGENENSEREFQIFEHLRKSEAAVVEQKRREVRQFVVVLKNPSQALEK